MGLAFRLRAEGGADLQASRPFTNYLAAPQYVTHKEIAAIAPCTAVIASRTPCSSTFGTMEGKWFGIGDPGSGAQISQFIWSMKEGQTNKFPDVFLNYQSAPNYRTAKEILGDGAARRHAGGTFHQLLLFHDCGWQRGLHWSRRERTGS